MKKKVLSLVLALCMALALLPTAALADDSDFTINSNGILTKYSGPGGNIVIPDGVTGIASSALSGANNITGVTIPSSVTIIGGNAFSKCVNLSSVTIAEGVESIGNNAFSGCTSLTSVTIPSSVTSVGRKAFNDTPWRENQGDFFIVNGILVECQSSDIDVTVPSGVKRIGDMAFTDCSQSLTSVKIPAGVTSIGESAFADCTRLASIELPEGLSSIGASTFSGCASLTSIELPKGVTSIGESAFASTRLTSIELPEGLTSIESKAFYKCFALDNITFPSTLTNVGADALSDTAWWKAQGEFVIAGSVLLRYQGSDNNVAIPDGITVIGEKAFASNKLSSVTIPDSVTMIADSAFSGCTTMIRADLPSHLTSIGNQAFYKCSSLLSLDLPAGVTSIGDQAFDSCTSITSVTLPASLTSAGKQAFANCSNLSSLTILPGVAHIGEEMFYKCSKLTSVAIPASAAGYIGPNAFSKSAITTVTFLPGVTHIGLAAFSDLSSITSVYIPASVTSIGLAAFESCRSKAAFFYGGSEAQWKNVTQNDIDMDLMFTLLAIEYGMTREEFDSYFPAEEQAAIVAQIVAEVGAYEFENVQYNSAIPVPTVGGFNDVTLDQYYAGPVLWAVGQGITKGTNNDGTEFSPEDTCTHVEIITFLWRAAGSPASTATAPVTVESYYVDPVNWAYGEGLIDGSFNPNAPCTRADTVNYMWKAKGSPNAAASSFNDVPASAAYAPAVNWAVNAGVTQGTGAGVFSPSDTCTRGQIVTFLYRAFA